MTARRPRALVLCFFPAFTPASSGGELRLGRLYHALAARCDITMLTSTNFGGRREEIQHCPGFREIRFPKDEIWRAAYATLEEQGISGDLSGLAFALAVADPACELARTARALATRSDVVIHEFPYSEPIFADGSAPYEIYHSHNFEIGLLGSICHGEGLEEAFLKLARIEANLARRARHVFATCTDDAERFRLFTGVAPERLALSRNGYDLPDLAAIAEMRADRPPNDRPSLLFTGSAHPPNVDAARWLAGMAANLPNCDIVIAGGVSTALHAEQMPANVILAGPFDTIQREQLLVDADIFLNPVVAGSGTSLKAVEALGAGITMVSTPQGVRGLDLLPGRHAAICPRTGFVEAITGLVADPARAHRLAAAGRTHVEANFTWDAIAAEVADRIEAELSPPPAKRRRKPPAARPLLLALNDYPILHTVSGGAARLAGGLASLDADVILVSFGPGYECALLAPGLLHVTVRKSASHAAFERAVNDGHPVSISDGVAALFVAENRALATLLGEFVQRADAVDFEHCYMAPALDGLRALRPDLPVIYSAHNVEALLKPQLLRPHPLGERFATFIAELESRLVAAARLVVCCTEADANHFKRLGARTVLLPNGCANDVPLPTLPAGRPVAGFLGSGHGPNLDAARFIVERLAPRLPDVDFALVGGVCDALPLDLPANVRLHGVVDEDAKSAILSGWHIGLNPLSAGGGASLKVPDYMAHGLAVISTAVGCRGVPVAEAGAGVVCPLSGFAAALSGLLARPAELDRQRHRAHAYAQASLSWHALAAPYREALAGLWQAPTPTARRLLVVTYRYTEPALGGAEEYLREILAQLRPFYRRIDLAAADIGHITNRHHFATAATPAPGGPAARIAALFDQAQFFPVEQPAEADSIAACREIEQSWMREQQTLHAPFAPDLLRADPGRIRLFSGFYWPENHGGLIRRWTSTDFTVLLPASARVLRLVGWSPLAGRLALSVIATTAGARTRPHTTELPIDGSFSLSLSLPDAAGARLLVCRVDEFRPDSDHRPLGVLLESVSVLVSTTPTDRLAAMSERFAEMTEEVDQWIREHRFDRWVAGLRDTARTRPAAIEDRFATVRGPHAPQMQRWIADNAANYDCVLVQGIPFDVIPTTVTTLHLPPPPGGEGRGGGAAHPRIVTLPHFHGDDRFYYWRRYLDAFAAADATLLFSASLRTAIGDLPGTAIVPGGGVRPDETIEPDARARFAELHPSTAPFFLVLGRKTASKNYRMIIAAHTAARARGLDAELLLIGPDEDGAPITQPGVTYLGRQPRAVVRGALAACLGLISMSGSESFGIVLCEAWLFRKPVIANRACYSFRDLVREDDTGLLAATTEELATAMLRLAADPAARARMGDAGFAEVIEKYSWAGAAQSIEAVLAP